MEQLYNQITKVHMKLTPTQTGWKLETSVDKKVWIIENVNLTLDQVMEIKNQTILDNYKNLNSIISKP